MRNSERSLVLRPADGTGRDSALFTIFSRARNQGLALLLVENWFEELKSKVR